MKRAEEEWEEIFECEIETPYKDQQRDVKALAAHCKDLRKRLKEIESWGQLTDDTKSVMPETKDLLSKAPSDYEVKK